jgi:hypothetical protein
MKTDLVKVKSFSSRTEAEIAKGLLASHGIKSLITADDVGGMFPYPLSGSFSVDLRVPQNYATKAANILKDL